MHRATQSETENSNAHRLGELRVERHQETSQWTRAGCLLSGGWPSAEGGLFPQCWSLLMPRVSTPCNLRVLWSQGAPGHRVSGVNNSLPQKKEAGFLEKGTDTPCTVTTLATTTTPPRVGGLLRNFLVKFAKQISHKHKNQKTGDFKVPTKAEVLSYCHASLTFLPACQVACRGELHFKILHLYLFLALRTNKAYMKCLGFSILMNSLEILKTREKYLSNSNGNQLTCTVFCDTHTRTGLSRDISGKWGLYCAPFPRSCWANGSPNEGEAKHGCSRYLIQGNLVPMPQKDRGSPQDGRNVPLNVPKCVPQRIKA